MSDPELTRCLAELEYCSTKVEGAVSAVNNYTKRVPAGDGGADDLVAVCDTLKRYLREFWEVYDRTMQALDKPSDSEIQALLDSLEKSCRRPDV